MVKVGTVSVGQGIIPEGKTIFKVESVDDSKYEDFGKLQINLITQKGQKHTERFAFRKKNGELNEGAQKAWSFWVGTILDQWGAGEADTDDLVGKFLEADVKHEESDQVSDKTGKPFINVRLESMSSVNGFDGVEAEVENDKTTKNDDLDDLDDL